MAMVPRSGEGSAVCARVCDGGCGAGNGVPPLVPKVDTAHDGQQALRTVTSTREGVEHEKHVGLRAQKPPLPGVRPGSLLDPGPQRSDRTVRHSAGEAPLLVVASLAGGDEVDATTVSFLLRENLKLQKEEEEEEEERRRKREEAQHEARMRELDRRVWADEQLTPAESHAWRKWAGFFPSEPRRKKKRKKKKLPRAPRPRQGCRRLCDHQRHVPAVRIAVVTQRQVPTVHLFMLPIQFLDKVLDMPAVVLRQVLRSMVQKTVESPQLHFIDGRRHSLSFRRGRSSWSRLFSGSSRFRSCRSFFRWSMSLLCWSCRFSGAAVEKTAFLLTSAGPDARHHGRSWLNNNSYAATPLCLAT